VLGYPGGYGMVSQSVATPLQGAADAFVVDGNWNPGVSGGAIFALRGDRDELEWVGMARAGAAERELRLVPPETSTRDHDLAVPYAGPVYLEETLRIQYGITLSIPMTAIRRLVNASRDRLTALGYVIPSL